MQGNTKAMNGTVPRCNDERRFGGLTITLEDNGETLLTSPVVDQAALHGVLKKVRDVGMPLLSVSPVEPGQAEVSDANETHQHRSKKE
jgi:hypothetical protein